MPSCVSFCFALCAIWLHLCLKRVPRSWFSGGGTLAKTAHFLSESILGWVRFLSTEIGSGHIDSRALIRQIDKVLRGIDVFLHESERVPIRFIITSLDSMTIAFYLSTFIGDALWSRSIRWNIKSFPIIHLAPSLLPVFLLGVRGGDRGSKNDSGCLKARPIPRRCHFKLELGFPYSSNSDEVLRQYVRLCPREPPKGGFRV